MDVMVNIESNPFIIRFKTKANAYGHNSLLNIESNPFIIRFKTNIKEWQLKTKPVNIESNPFIIRFKTN